MYRLKIWDFVRDYLQHVEHKEHLFDVHDRSLFVLLPYPSKNEKKDFINKTTYEMRLI